MTSPDRSETAASATAVDVLLQFAAAMMRAGATAVRTRELARMMARKLDLELQAISLTPEHIAVCIGRGGETMMAARDIAPPAINAWRIGELEKLAISETPTPAPADVARSVAAIETATPHFSGATVAACVGMASGAFAFLNGAGPLEMSGAAIGGGFGQWARSWLAHRRFNQFGVAALSGLIASGLYVLSAALASQAGFPFFRYQTGFISAVLFLIPGFPLIAGLFDLLQHQTAAAVSRLIYCTFILLTVAAGLSVVVALASIDLSRPKPVELPYSLILALRATASFVASCAFAMLFNSTARTILVAGAIAMLANSLRLILIDTGMPLAAAALIAALFVGLIALFMNRRFDVGLVAIVAAPIVIMIPGLYAFETIVLLNHGRMFEAIQAFAQCAFVVFALAMGLSAARLASRR